jgi:hypothetical protein
MSAMPQDALLNLLFPMWQVVIGVTLLGVLLVSTHRLLGRGPSRMSRALVVTGSAALAVAVLGILLASR